MTLIQYLLLLLVLLLLLSWMGVRYYAAPHTSLAIRTLSTIVFALGFSGTVLLPVDLSIAEDVQGDTIMTNTNTYTNNDNGGNGGNGRMLYYNATAIATDNDITDITNDMTINITYLPWHILFWSTFLMAWLVLPLVREMLLSGEFTIMNQFIDGWKKTMTGLILMSGLGLVGIIWLEYHLKEFNVIPVLITLGNTYGLLLVALLLGYGLVAFPRSLWRQSSAEQELNETFLHAVSIDDALYDAVWSLQDVEYDIDMALCRIVDWDPERNRGDVFYRYCVNELLERKNMTSEMMSDELHSRRTTNGNQIRPVRSSGSDNSGSANGNDSSSGRIRNDSAVLSSGDDGRPSLDELVKLNRKLKWAQENLFNAEQRWNALLNKHAYFSSEEFGLDAGISMRAIASSDVEMSTIGRDHVLVLDGEHSTGHNNGVSPTNNGLRGGEGPGPVPAPPSSLHKSANQSLLKNSEEDKVSTNDLPMIDDESAFPRSRCPYRCPCPCPCPCPCQPLSPRANNSKLGAYMWKRYFRSINYRMGAIFAGVLSCAVLWSEATLASKYNLSPFSLVQEYLSSDEFDEEAEQNAYIQNNEGILFQIAALIPLLYMSICVASGLFSVGRFGPYCLRGNQQSTGIALVFNAQYLVRLQFSLGYNYLLMLKYDTSDCAFSQFVGQMDVVPLFGKSFLVYAPLLILLLCALTLCNFYAKLMNLLGMDHSDALLVGDQEALDTKIQEGRNLLKQYLLNTHGSGSGGISSSSSFGSAASTDREKSSSNRNANNTEEGTETRIWSRSIV